MNGMFTLIAIGFIGGLITGISPCILPVLPVIFFSGTQGVTEPVATKDAASVGSESGGSVATEAPPKASLSDRLRPYRVIAGLVLSFSIVTLAGSALLSLLHLPQDAIRWIALVALVAIGLGLIFPKIEELLEKPFSKLPQKQFGSGNGFGLGLALGVLYVPCAGPVLAAIVLAGATGTIGLGTVALTLSFALGAALPLLFFALAGAGRPTRHCIPQPPAPDSRCGRHRDDSVGSRAGVQPARGAATRDPGLHQLATGEGRQ